MFTNNHSMMSDTTQPFTTTTSTTMSSSSNSINSVGIVKKPPIAKPVFSSTSSFPCYEEDTRTPPSLVCNSPSSMFVDSSTTIIRKQQQHGREALANITNSNISTSTNGLNKRQQTFKNHPNENPCCRNSRSSNTTATIQCSTMSLNQSQLLYFANGKTNATVHPQVQQQTNGYNHSNSQQQQFNTSSHHQTFNNNENMTLNNTQGNQYETTINQESSTSPSNSCEQDPNTFNDFSMESCDEEDEEDYSSSDEDMQESDDEQPQPQPQHVDPDLLNQADRQRLQCYLDFNTKNPVNLLPKSSSRTLASSCAHLPLDVEDDILSYLFNNQSSKKASPIVWQSVQNRVTPKMRTMLVEWIVGVSVSFKLLPETLYLSIDILDRFMCKVCITDIKLLQGYGLACVFIAAKYCETLPPPLIQFLFAADNTYKRGMILALEREICNAIEFEFCSIQTFDFVEKFLEITGHVHDHTVKNLTYYICELQLQNFDSLQFNKSTIALSALIIALYVTEKPLPYQSIATCLGNPPTLELVIHTNNCLMIMYNYYFEISWNRNHPNNFVKEKFSRSSFNSVAVTVAPRTGISPRLE